jgi:hypothetical protein
MSQIISPSQAKREGIISSLCRKDSKGKPIQIPWLQYLYEIIRKNKRENEDTICIFLDEQGDKWLEMTIYECITFIEVLRESIDYFFEQRFLCTDCKKKWKIKNQDMLDNAKNEWNIDPKTHKITHKKDNGKVVRI